MFGHSASAGLVRYNGIKVQSSIAGAAITLGWGRARIKCNLIWYGDFNSVAQKQAGGKGGGSISSYSYYATFIAALCEGPITGVRTVYLNSSVYTGNDDFTALQQAKLSVMLGAAGQAPWGYMTSKHASQARGYSSTAYVYASNYGLGTSPTLPNFTFEVDFALQHSSSVPDANPKDIVTDYLTNAQYGLPGWSSSFNGDWSAWSNYGLAAGLLLSPVEETQRTARDFVSEMLLASNSDATWSEGVLKVVPYGDTALTGNGATYTPNLTPIYDLTEDDLIPVNGVPVSLNIIDQSQAFNFVQIEYLNRATQYNTEISQAQDAANINRYGRRSNGPTSIHSICDAQVAQQVAQLLLQRSIQRRDVYSFKGTWNLDLLEPLDYVTLTTTTDGLKLNRQLVQITEIEDDEDGTRSFKGEGVFVGTAHAALYSTHSGSGFSPNFDVAPGSVSTPVLINAPTSLTGGAAEVWIAAASTNANWGGCEVWVSADDIQYQRVGSITAAARLGVSTATLASHADPDTTNTLSVDLTASNGALASSNSANANIGSTLCLIGTEIVSYQTATLTSANHYGLTNLRRGLYGTTIASHASGQTFARLDEALFKYDYGSLALGTTMYVKLQSFNTFGRAIEDISTVTAYTVQLSPFVAVGSGSLQSFTLVNRENCYIDGRTVTKITGSNAWGDASVVSSESFIGGCMCGFQPLQVNKAYMIGLNSDPATDDTYTSLDFAWFINNNGICQAYESGTAVGSSFSYVAGDVFQIIYQGTTVTYLQNGVTRRTNSAVSANLQLWLDSAFNDVGGKATNVTFAGTGAGADGYSTNVVTLWQRAASSPTLPSNDITYTFATQGMSPSPNNGWQTTPPAANGNPLWVTQATAFSNTTTATILHTAWTTPVQFTTDGLNTATVVMYQRAASAPTGSAAAPSATLTYTFSTGILTPSGSFNGWSQSPPAGSNPCYQIQATASAVATSATDTILTTEWSAPVLFVQNGANGTNGASTFTLINRSSMTISGSTVTKTGGTSAWGNGSVTSAEAFTNGASCGFKSVDGTHQVMIALNSDPNTDDSYTSLDYAWYINTSGNAQIWESNSYTGHQVTHTPGDVFQIVYSGTTVTYLQNGTSVWAHTGVSANQTLYLDSAFCEIGGSVTNLTFAKAGADGASGAGGGTTSPITQTNTGGTTVSTTTIVGNSFVTGGTVTLIWDGQIYYNSGGSGTANITCYLEYTTDPQRASGWTTVATNGPISFNSVLSPVDNSFSGTFTPVGGTAYYYRMRSSSTGAALNVNIIGGLTAHQ